jgi:hypothetical protein
MSDLNSGGSGCSFNPFASGSCFKQGWDSMSGIGQLEDATLPITLPLSVCGAGEEIDSEEVALSQVDRVGSALNEGNAYHRSVSWVVDDPGAQKFAFTGGDGVQRLLYQLPGELNDKPGVFEWILDESGSEPAITHQRFIEGGGVTGSPNQVP